MLSYVLNDELEDDELEDDEPIMFVAEDQRWDEATLKQLKEEYGVVYKTSGPAVLPVMIIRKDNELPLLVIGYEDDGRIYFEREHGHLCNTFHPCWAKPLIADLEEALRIVAEIMKMKFNKEE